MNQPCLVIDSDRDRNVMDMSKFDDQFTNVARALPKPLAQRGYISELIVHGIGPTPAKYSVENTKIYSLILVEAANKISSTLTQTILVRKVILVSSRTCA